ncbi:MAG: hypothetical protein WBF03_03090 [Xanthobacteraceae bacterium]
MQVASVGGFIGFCSELISAGRLSWRPRHSSGPDHLQNDLVFLVLVPFHGRWPLLILRWPLFGTNSRLGRFTVITLEDIYGRAMTASKDVGSRYREYATACIETARDLEPARKLTILEMARIWLKLAEQAVLAPFHPDWSLLNFSGGPLWIAGKTIGTGFEGA